MKNDNYVPGMQSNVHTPVRLYSKDFSLIRFRRLLFTHTFLLFIRYRDKNMIWRMLMAYLINFNKYHVKISIGNFEIPKWWYTVMFNSRWIQKMGKSISYIRFSIIMGSNVQRWSSRGVQKSLMSHHMVGAYHLEGIWSRESQTVVQSRSLWKKFFE